jgi:hypothetical protein
MLGIFFEPFGSERQLSSFDAFGIKVPGLLDRSRLVGQEVVGVGAQRRDAERLAGKRNPRAGVSCAPTRRI